ncbi:unnamed protein product [Fraxinus pennsylvanica]|uniref:Uncharacterized protein n=1 Tax=Fraxinus pennsylvanica TaxID=56036 RepID=A0AAD2E6J6_9LAMI|nr:unnamed protein product [Fraxinus pennsylvanica]
MQSSIGATQWILSDSSHIEEIEEDYSSLAEAHYEFTPFHELHAHIGSDKELGILQAITLTLWDILAKNEGSQLADLQMKRTVLIANHLKASLYRPRQSIASKDYVLINSTTTSCTPQNKLIPIKHILEHLSSYSQGTKFWVSTTISLKNPTNPLYYMACSLCARGASGNLGEVYSCNYCLHKHPISIQRARCDVDLRDSTGTLQASIIVQWRNNSWEPPRNISSMYSVMYEYIDSDSNYHLKYTNVEHSVYVKSGIPNPKT